jgi:hypothetical protein
MSAPLGSGLAPERLFGFASILSIISETRFARCDIYQDSTHEARSEINMRATIHYQVTHALGPAPKIFRAVWTGGIMDIMAFTTHR